MPPSEPRVISESELALVADHASIGLIRIDENLRVRSANLAAHHALERRPGSLVSRTLMETFVDPSRFRGICYRAAGWELLGETSGRGLARPGKSYRSTPRLVWVKPLHKDCRRLLCTGPLSGRPAR